MGNPLSSSSQKALIRAKLKPGSIIHIHCDFISNPKPKFCVIAHIDFEEDFVFIFLINSNIVPFIQNNPDMNRCQVKLSNSEYKFFSNPVSYLNCAQLYDELDLEYLIEHLLKFPTDYKGALLDKEIEEILQIVYGTNMIGEFDKNLIINSLGE